MRSILRSILRSIPVIIRCKLSKTGPKYHKLSKTGPKFSKMRSIQSLVPVLTNCQNVPSFLIEPVFDEVSKNGSIMHGWAEY